MRADVKNMGSSLRVVAVASALLVGCAAEPEDTYAVTGLELGSCTGDTWMTSATAMQSVVVETQGDDIVVSACDALSCDPMSPTRFAWNVDRWSGADGGAFLDAGGCVLVQVDATARLDGSDLVIETARWSSIADTCTIDAAEALRARPCDSRTRIHAVAQ